jgi:hypothetical protein
VDLRGQVVLHEVGQQGHDVGAAAGH